MAILYAAYGSNLHPVRLQQRVPSATLLGSGQLAGRAFRFHKRGIDGSGKGSLIEAHSAVHVAVYEMTPDGVSALDAIEGVGKGYLRTRVQLADFGSCITYVAQPEYVDDQLMPFDWYREMVLLGCRKFSFPDEYVTEIQRVAATIDPDKERCRSNWALVEQLRGACD